MILPIGWTSAPLSDVTQHRVEHGEPGRSSVNYIDIGSINRESKRVGVTEKVNSVTAPTRARQWVRSGDVLVSMTRPNLNAVAMVTPDLDGAVASTGFDVLRTIGILPEWLFYRVATYAFVQDVCRDVQGVVYPAIRPDDVRRHVLPIAPLDEQRRIVEAIESYLSRLDVAVATLERTRAKLKAYRASVLRAAVYGRLVPTEAELGRAEKRDYEPAEVLLKRILAERRRRWEEAELAKFKAAGTVSKNDKWKSKYEEPLAPDATGLPGLPDGWCWVNLGTLIVSGPQNGIYVPKVRYGAGTPILRIDDYQVDWSRSANELQRIQLEKSEAERYALRLNDLVLNRVNSPTHLGKTLPVELRHLPAVFESNMMRVEVSSSVQPRFLHFYLTSFAGKQRLTQNAKWAVNQASINQTDVANTVIPLPPQEEQKRIVVEIDRRLSVVTAAATAIDRDLQRVARLRQAVLKWAFEGKLVDQDPNDEPAENLLERIRAEGAASGAAKRARRRRATAAL